MTFLYIILFISISLNLLVFFVDTLPFIKPKIKRRIRKKDNDYKVNNLDHAFLEKKVAQRAVEMSKSDKNLTILHDNKNFTATIFYYLTNKKLKRYIRYHYPRAFLFYGISEYFKTEKNIDGLNKFKIVFDKIITEEGEPKFNLSIVDQAPYGLAALNLYEQYKENKYLYFIEKVYDQTIVANVNELGLVEYRKGQKEVLDDTLGMIIPFLVEYFKLTSKPEILDIARRQMDYYIKFGVDKDTFIPSHGITASNIKVGSINWGRGIGWYLLGLAKINEITNDYKKEFVGIYKSLEQLKTKENLYTQFPGSSDLFDASTSTMFLYSFSYLRENNYSRKFILNLFSKYISDDGSLMNTSGDTYWLNKYSESFGYSELSQGMLLLLLSRSKQ